MPLSLRFTLNSQDFSAVTGSPGTYRAFSGKGAHRNNPHATALVDQGPIPPGSYHIIARQGGGLLGPLRDILLDRSDWFALYRHDGQIDDQTFLGKVRRGEFRLHPLGPSGVSAGCVVLQQHSDFQALRAALLAAGSYRVRDAPAYGVLDVVLPVEPDPHQRRGHAVA